MPESGEGKLVRAIGRWSLAALTINSIIGSGVFGLPSVFARLLGAASPIGVILAGVVVAIIVTCFAEVASRFSATGGPYLYARAAFGRFVGIETGWLFWLTRISAPAANANLFVVYLGEFWPQAISRWPRFLILTVLIWGLAAVNIRGVKAGAQVSNGFTIAKLLPLLAIVLAGTWFLVTRHQAFFPKLIPLPFTTWLDAMLPLIFAYGGYETALTPMAESRNPQRDSVFALFVALGTCILVYTLIQWVAVGILPDLSGSSRPLADVARAIFGESGAVLISIGALIALYGYLSANMLGVPRITYAMAECGDFPSIFAAIHPEFRTPYFSILSFAFVTWILALAGSFAWNVTLSSVARLFYYAVVCAALPVFHRKGLRQARFRAPAGLALAILGVLICLTLITRVERSGMMVLLVTVILAGVNWLWARTRPSREIEAG
jgi:basic amino acid/polyamine antiporter, APA family